MITYQGIRIFDGIAIGKIKYLKFSGEIEKSFGKGKTFESDRFKKAQSSAILDMKKVYEKAKKELSSKDADIINAHIAMLEDLDFLDLVQEGLDNNYSAEYATFCAGKNLSEMLSQMDDEYMKARASDVMEISMKVIDILQNNNTDVELTEPCILVADDIPSSVLLKMDRKYVRGIVLLKTSTNSHISILVRTMEIPSIASVSKTFNPADDGAVAILDGNKGKLLVRYETNTLLKYFEKQKKYEDTKKDLQKYLNKKAKTIDGKTIEIGANISSANEVESAKKNGAEGIGLFRSEFIYLSSNNFPTEDEQFAQYKTVVEAMGEKETVIRTLDIGADKKIGYFNLPEENNPALGYRSIRICQDRTDIFLTQLQALYRASAFGNLSIMIPMIISEKEIDFAHNMCEMAMKNLDLRGIKYNKNMRVGIMIETPSAAILSDRFAKKVDFFSIGTNDLSQYTLAIDRQNQMLNKFFDPRAKSILRFIKLTVENAHKEGIHVAICGELARDPKLTGFFIKLGVDELSVSSPYILQLKSNISKVDTDKINIDDYIN